MIYPHPDTHALETRIEEWKQVRPELKTGAELADRIATEKGGPLLVRGMQEFESLSRSTEDELRHRLVKGGDGVVTAMEEVPCRPFAI